MKVVDSITTFFSYTKQPSKRPLIKEAFQLKGQVGLEIGGPSTFFFVKGGFPVYVFAKRVDGVNYSNETMWEGKIKQGKNYRYFRNKTGFQYIKEATDLGEIADHSYDFVLSSHSLEHVANPIKALKEWCRVLKTNGKLILVLPDKRHTFDHKREYSTFEHIVADYQNETSEHDTTHHEEILQTHDETKTNLEHKDFEAILSNNFSNRIAHHHVFSPAVAAQVLVFSGFKVEKQFLATPFHMITIAVKAS